MNRKKMLGEKVWGKPKLEGGSLESTKVYGGVVNNGD